MHEDAVKGLLVCIGLLLCVLIVAASIQLSLLEPETETYSAEMYRRLAESGRLPQTTDPFDLGQYYFNHDGDPAGPYDLAKARSYFTKAIAEDPLGEDLQWHQLGRIDFIQGRFSSAIYKFKKQIEYFGEEVPNVYYMLGLTYGYRARETGNEEDWQKAEEAFEHFIDIYATDWASRLDLSWIYFAQGKYEEMKPLLEEALTNYPDVAWLHNMYGLALMNTGELEAAKEHFYLARKYASKLTTKDWGRAYPGNDPTDWPQGLSEFREAIEKNIQLIEKKMAAEE